MESPSELHRPQFHFTAKENWINDPNGLVWQAGRWHLFFQRNPESNVWGNMTWGHAVSDDLLHWEQLEDALHPDSLGTMFSGSAVIDRRNSAGFGDDTMLIFYTAAGEFVDPSAKHTQCLAYSLDGGNTLKKFDANPVIPWMEGANRDTKVVWHPQSDSWIMALYLKDDRYCLLRSPDAKNWERFQDITLPGVTECPDFFQLEDDEGVFYWIFWGADGKYLLGTFDGDHFDPITDAIVCEQGKNGYAAQTWSNAPDGRCIQISWMAGGKYPDMPFNQQLSIPVELELAGTGANARLTRRPIKELDSLRGRKETIDCIVVSRGKSYEMDLVGKCFDVSFELEAGDAKVVYLTVRGEWFKIDWESFELSAFSGGATKSSQPNNPTVFLPRGQRMSFRFIIDTCSIEVFVNGGVVSASFCFLADGYEYPLVFNCYEGSQKIKNIECYELLSSLVAHE